DPALVQAFIALHRAIEDGTDALAEREQLYRCFAGLFARYGSGTASLEGPPVDRSVIAAIVDFMHAHHDQDLSLDDMGRQFALTPPPRPPPPRLQAGGGPAPARPPHEAAPQPGGAAVAPGPPARGAGARGRLLRQGPPPPPLQALLRNHPAAIRTRGAG